jgi:hypothetical protein
MMISGNDFAEDKLPNKRILNAILISIILASVVVRGFFAWTLELGNDEVYYWTYALFPDLSHFDHPPMVGFTIQAFSWNLTFDSELFIRMGSVILGGANTWLIFLLARHAGGFLAGLFAAMLYNTSVYCFVIAGIFILPDTPQLFFWLISLNILLRILPGRPISGKRAMAMFFVSVPIGLAMLSKYTSVFLWVGAGLYILLYNRAWLRKSELYLSVLMTLLIFSPVIFWNIDHKFISFTFQSERIGFFGTGLRPDYFLTELFGQVFYNNPVNYILIILALVALFRNKFRINREHKRVLLATSFPLILLFLFFALFRQTLPHWTAPGYISLMVIAATYLAARVMKPDKAVLFPRPVVGAASLLMIVLVLGLLQIKLGLIPTGHTDDPKKLGSKDLTLDMYGWTQFGHKFSQLAHQDFYSKKMTADAPVISHKWFPAAHLDYYVARPHGFRLLAIGDLNAIHKYAWINRERAPIRPGSDAYFITNSRNYKDPDYLLRHFELVDEPEIIRIYKQDKHVENFFVYRLRNCFDPPPDVLEEYDIPGVSDQWDVPQD